MKRLLSEYKLREKEIKNRLQEFDRKKERAGSGIFEELCFCLLTPQSKAVSCARAVKELKRKGLLFKAPAPDISAKLRGLARFHNKKAAYLVNARQLLEEIRKKIRTGDTLQTREWLVKNIKGLGYKEASHFLRNIGLGKGMAILDVHILKNLKKLGVIKKIPSSLSRKSYLDIEEKMRGLAAKTGVPLEELDLLFWSRETGFVFK